MHYGFGDEAGCAVNGAGAADGDEGEKLLAKAGESGEVGVVDEGGGGDLGVV